VTADLSVVIPCRNGAQTLGKQLEALLEQQTEATFEIIVADNGSTDGTAELVTSYPRVRLIDASREAGVNVARNEGVRASTGRYILLTDADDMVHPGWIQAYWKAFHDGAECAGGGLNQVLPSGELLSHTRKLFRALGGEVYPDGANCGFRRDAYDAVGGFDEAFKGGADEIDFFWRTTQLNYSLTYIPDAVIDKLMREQLSQVFDQQFAYGRGYARLIAKSRPRALQLTVAAHLLVPTLWGVWFLTGARLSLRWRRKAIMSIAWALGLVAQGLPSA
jgi:glycosyltransferase involved in cell wall biosynthesis